jgi:phosphatidylglycerophosphate synthase
MAKALTAARLLLAAPFTLLALREDPRSAMISGLVLAVALATDVLDGMAARRYRTGSPLSDLFDHATDCVFVTSGLAAVASRAAVPWLLPVCVAVAFVQYVVDSYWVHRAGRLRTSALGRWNGVLYFAPLAGDAAVRAGLVTLAPAVTALAWTLVVSTLISMGERLWAVRRASRRAPGSPAAGTGDRRPR